MSNVVLEYQGPGNDASAWTGIGRAALGSVTRAPVVPMRGLGRAACTTWRRLALCLSCTALILGMTCTQAAADSISPPFSYKKVSANGHFVFVMISWLPAKDDAARWIEPMAADIRNIRKTYSQSGLYRNDGSTTPLWTVDWYARDVHIASDGMHLVRPGPWASSRNQEAVSFFAKGELLCSYRIADLVDFPGLMPHSVSHFFWDDKARFDDQKLTYTIRTLHGERYVFDARTGAMISSFRLPRLILGVVIGGLLGFWLLHRRRRRPRQQPSRERLVAAGIETLGDYEPFWASVVNCALLFALAAFVGAKARLDFGRWDFVLLWLPAFFANAIVAMLVATYRRACARRRRAENRCVVCGYDLRASKERCPECGTVISAN